MNIRNISTNLININYIFYSIKMQVIKSLNILILLDKLNVYHNFFNI